MNVIGYAALMTLWLGGGMTGKEALDALNKYRNDLQQEAIKARDANLMSQVAEKVAAKANELIGDMDPASVDAKESLDWSMVFASAKRQKDALFLAQRYLETKPTGHRLFECQAQILTCAAQVPDAVVLKRVLLEAKPQDAIQSVNLANSTAYIYLDIIEKNEGKQSALDVLGTVEKNLVWTGLANDKQKPMVEAAQIAMIDSRRGLLTGLGRKSEAITELKAFRATMPADSQNIRRVDAMIVQGELLEATAPAINFTASIGEFKSLESLKGKLVLVDFFAHWCGPCIRSFPDLVRMKEELGAKGLEIVGVTRYYGYYKRENAEKRDMAPDVEFGKMKEFMAEHNISWPVLYTEKTPYEAYGVTGIPHVAVVGRDGKVKHTKIGYSPEGMASFRAMVEKLLTEN